MQRLGWKQTRAVLKALDVLYSDVEPATLPLRILKAAKRAVASENVMVDSFGPAGEMRSLAQYPAGLMSPPEYAALTHNLPYHPLFTKVVLTRRSTPFRVKDVIPSAELRRTTFYNEIFRPMSISDQLVVGVRGLQSTFITCCLSRTRGGDYDDSERRMIGLVNSHLASAVKAAQSLHRTRSREVYLQSALGASLRGLVVLTPSGEVKYATDSAHALMQKHFGRGAFGAKRLPRQVELWLARHEESRRAGDYYPPLPPLTARGDGAELRINLVPGGADGERLLLVEEKSFLSPQRIEALGLTRREAEVLFWVAQGKTDGEVATLCGNSPRTVQIHLTRVYAKLGVENRTAAALKVIELLQA